VPNSVFITGATGVVGSHLLSMLVADGHDVTALVRTEDAADAMTASGVRPVVGDIRETDLWAKSMWGMDVVYHVAGINQVCPFDRDLMRRVNVDGSVSVVAAAADAGVGRVVLTSSVAAIGEAEGMIGTEATRHGGDHLSAYARSKHEGEVAALAAATERGVHLIVVNPASVQGPGRSTGSAEMLLRVLRAERPWLVDTTVSIVDLEDCSRGHILAAELGSPGERYILSGASVSVDELVGIVNAIVDTPVNPRWLSPAALRTFGVPAAAVISMLKPGSEVCADLIRTMLHGHRFSNTRSREKLGLAYTPIESTVARTIAWFADEGLLE
jgi:nucleoside-diphosphate-sugar epimerase